MADAALETRDAAALRQRLTGWIAAQVRDAGLDGAVIGLSGGIDSAVVCGLAAEALGAERCLGLFLPIESSDDDARLARATASRFGVPAVTISLDETFRTLLRTLVGGDHAPGSAGRDDAAALARANLKPRLRMLALYYHANLRNAMVLGTGNRAERTVGYFTKWGDGAADAFPLADLVKREVRALAAELDVPREIIERPPSAGLWAGQTDEAELGFSYAQLDRYLLTGSSGDAAVDAAIRERAAGARHKLVPPPVAEPD